jgi:hypothetical protein
MQKNITVIFLGTQHNHFLQSNSDGVHPCFNHIILRKWNGCKSVDC